jgi:hypothetical protein
MNPMQRFGLILVAFAGFAQQATLPPPKELDEALKARVSKFFQAHVDGKFRVADEVVAEDSKDYFFEAEKPRYRGFAIKDIKYSEDFLRAQVVVDCDTEMNVPRMGRMAVKVPRTSRWKFVDGDWFWFVDPNQVRDTPFGPMKPGPPAQGGGDLPIIPPANPSSVAGMSQGIRADKTQVVLLSDEPSSDTITVSNSVSGWITLQVVPPDIPGLSVRVEKPDVAPNGSSTIVFDYKPAGPPPPGKQMATVGFLPMGGGFRVGIVFKPGEKEAAKPAPVKEQQKGKKK